jgi:CRISPR system Cascade subunit CasE
MMAHAMTPLFLSRLLLNPRSRQVMAEMAHPYEMHRTLMRGFPLATDETISKARDEYGVLFRADMDDLPGVVKVYVQSRIEPNWSFLNQLDDYLCADMEMSEYEYKDIMPAFRKIRSGQVLSFRLRANPTKRIARQGDPMKGKRVALARDDERIDWLIRKGQAMGEGVPGGFQLLTNKVEDVNGEVRLVPRVNVCCEGRKTGRKRDAARGHATTHSSVLFDGLLRVTDTNAFLQTVVRGIGPSKAFGFGLLSIAPVDASASEDAR